MSSSPVSAEQSFSWKSLLLISLSLTVIPFLFLVFGAQQRRTVPDALDHLHYWDSVHYADIVDDGYFSRLPEDRSQWHLGDEMIEWANVAFFPAFPLLARSVQSLTGLRTEYALLLTSNIANFGFWIMFFVLLHTWKIRKRHQVIAAAAMLLFPASFFLSVGYSESLFLLALTGLLLWSEAPRIRSTVLASVSGFLLTLTRVFGIALSAYPLLRMLCLEEHSRKNFLRACAIMAVSLLGALSFFTYSQVAFGHWNLYFLTQKEGWGVNPDSFFWWNHPRAVLLPWTYPDPTDALWSNRMLLGIFCWAIPVIALFEYLWGTERRKRIPLYVCAALTLFLSASAVAGKEFQSLLRYMLPVHLLVMLALTRFADSLHASMRVRRTLLALTCVLLLSSGYWMITLADRFVHRTWVA